jgi:hypothetical protein
MDEFVLTSLSRRWCSNFILDLFILAFGQTLVSCAPLRALLFHDLSARELIELADCSDEAARDSKAAEIQSRLKW